MEGHRFARPSRGGGLIPRATAGLDRWLSRQNPAYRPALPKSTPSYRWGAFYVIHSLLFTIHMPCSKYRGIYNRGSRGRPLAARFFCTEINASHCEPARTQAWPLPGDSPWSQSVLPWLPLWGSCHEVTERVNIALSTPTGHLSHRARQVALIRLALAGDARATFPQGKALGTDCHTLYRIARH